MYSDSAEYKNFNGHLFLDGNRPEVSKILNIKRGGKLQPFAARYIMLNPLSAVPRPPQYNLFVPMVQMAARGPYEGFLDGKHIRRQSTRMGSFSIRDRRVTAYNEDNVPINNISFYIPMSEISNVSDSLKGPKIDRLPFFLDQDRYDEVMFGFANIMKHAIDRPSETSALFLDHIFEAVCIHIAQTYGGLQIGERLRHGALSIPQERRIKSLLLDNLSGDIRLEELASRCGMSRGHLIRAFKQSTGMPPHRWLLAQRVDRARDLLRNTAAPISEIALDCGFADQSHLTRVFSKAVGASPAAWRRDRRE
jgi:AraC family transcriptional regulator